VDALLLGVATDPARDSVKARIRGDGGPVYAADPHHPGRVVRIDADGTRTSGRFQHRQFVAGPAAPATRLVARMVKRKPSRRK
jgi:hypothetical protein